MSKVTLQCELVGIHKSFTDENIKGLDGNVHLSITGKFVAKAKEDRHNAAKVFRVNARFDTYEVYYNLLKEIADAEEGKDKTALIAAFNSKKSFINKAVRDVPLYFVHDVKEKGAKAEVRFFRANHLTLKDHPILATKITEYWFDHEDADSEDIVCDAKTTQITNANMFVSDDTIEEYLDMDKITNSNVKKRLLDGAKHYVIDNDVVDRESTIIRKPIEKKDLSQAEIDELMEKEAEKEHKD